MPSYNDYSVRIRKTTTNLRKFFEVTIHDEQYKVIDEVVAKNRPTAYLSAYKLVVKHCGGLSAYGKCHLTMRLVGYYFYLCW